MTGHSDLDLYEVGRAQVPRGGCLQGVVATGKDGVRAYHPCNVVTVHEHRTHHCDCGGSWRYIFGDERWSLLGDLTDPFFPAQPWPVESPE